MSSSNNDDNNNAKNSSAIRQYPIQSIAADSLIDQSLAEALLASVAHYRDQLHGRRIWLACSGGRDSLALAALCLQLYRRGDLPFLPQLLHVNHGLQADSDHWAQHVAQWAQAQQMPCHILRATVNGHDEQAARQARYQVMFAHINQDDVLLLAHHADDQAETVLMRLMQGAGVNGLSGMQPWREQSQGARCHVLWRPWLTVRRTAITTYAEQLKLPYINDPTNDDGDNVRSGLRRDIMPLLATYNANVVHNIARSAQLLADAHATVSTQAAQDSQYTAISPLCQPPFQRVLDIDKLQSMPLHRQRQLLHYWLAQDESLPPAKQLIDDVLALTQRTDANHQTTLDWYASKQIYTIRRYRQHLYRLSHSFLQWLTLPINEQTLTLSSHCLFDNASKKKTETITLRSNDSFCWQLQFTPDTIKRLLTYLLEHQSLPPNLSVDIINIFENEADFLLKIAPLGRQQRLQTAFATRPQAGKKLTQTLAMPVWLRDSLVVISVVSTHTNEELPLLLVSPFDSWMLGFDKSAAGITSTILDSDFSFRTTVRTISQCHQDDSN
ncbi:tRNA lysidine(34) synthetase TilS [Psychrobacter urativorans]|uniref:tRNA(Ile)-lysidine synthase n=1 Tax=Psychrobacter urativorans TaxID=45610 RepID=A0A0M5MNI9_9GAMM|nr:tRNA lysidine(34) synthetase TilS [Psychrobacter urativorans]ALF59868.1 tRNA(Ile)-lysidine synthetase [Psychrobacter urativorans]